MIAPIAGMLRAGNASAGTPLVRLSQPGLGLAVMAAGLLLVLAGIHLPHPRTCDRRTAR